MHEHVILVDENDNAIGKMEKLEAHLSGRLHRAFSVLIYNSNGQMLLQKRADDKYHSGGLWTNACCSHPKPDETIEDATQRRLKEEMGIEARPTFDYKFIYKAQLDNNLIEHECDHVFTCITDQPPTLNQDEAQDFKYISIDELYIDIDKNPNHYTYWFKEIMSHLKSSIEIKS